MSERYSIGSGAASAPVTARLDQSKEAALEKAYRQMLLDKLLRLLMGEDMTVTNEVEQFDRSTETLKGGRLEYGHERRPDGTAGRMELRRRY